MKLVTAAQMRELDRICMDEYGVPGLLLMDAAAKQVADFVLELLGERRQGRVLLFCGGGNNGGDGFGAARWLAAYGAEARVALIGAAEEKISGDAAAELAMYKAAGGRVEAVRDEDDWLRLELAAERADILVDALLGTGFAGELRAETRRACQLLNRARALVVAVDVPSGANATDGSACADAARADYTVTMGLVKTGLLLEPARSHAGKICVAGIGMPARALEAYPSKKYRLDAALLAKILPQRAPDAHKGDAGRVLICAGSPGFTGAAALASQAAVKAGAGLVSLVTPLASREVLAVKLTEVMVHGLLERMPGVLGSAAASDVLKRAQGAQVLAIGPGLGLSESTRECVREILGKCEVPLVIDADALTALAGRTQLLKEMRAPKILTPHVGEMARLAELSVEEINKNRMDIAAKFAAEWDAVLVLKGAPTLVALPDGDIFFNSTGTNALATGGSGDVLTGIIAALVAQGASARDAALAGVYLHGLAASMACAEIGLAAGEISAWLPFAREKIFAEKKTHCAGGRIMIK